MDEDRTKGTATQAKGTVKQAIGKVTGDAGVEAEGTAEKSARQARKTLGLAKDKAHTALDDNN